jgi:hypothetical protein
MMLTATLLAGPRLDGVYRSGHLFLRFYPDGTVIETAAPPRTPPDQMRGWLTPALSMVSKGQWQLDHGKLSLHVIVPREPGISEAIAIDYLGKIDRNVLDLRWKSSHEKRSLDERGHARFRFLRFWKGDISP